MIRRFSFTSSTNRAAIITVDLHHQSWTRLAFDRSRCRESEWNRFFPLPPSSSPLFSQKSRVHIRDSREKFIAPRNENCMENRAENLFGDRGSRIREIRKKKERKKKKEYKRKIIGERRENNSFSNGPCAWKIFCNRRNKFLKK